MLGKKSHENDAAAGAALLIHYTGRLDYIHQLARELVLMRHSALTQ